MRHLYISRIDDLSARAFVVDCVDRLTHGERVKLCSGLGTVVDSGVVFSTSEVDQYRKRVLLVDETSLDVMAESLAS